LMYRGIYPTTLLYEASLGIGPKTNSSTSQSQVLL
jgi:hypothetical protein